MRISLHKNGFGIGVISPVAVGFGLLTIKEGGVTLFGGEAAQASAGSVPALTLAKG